MDQVDQYSQNELQNMEDDRANMLNFQDGEQMINPPEEEDSELKKSNYEFFDLNTIRNTYLGNKMKQEEHSMKTEAIGIKKEGKGGKGKHLYLTKSFFQRLGPQYADLPI